MKLSILTINYNNAIGLQKTVESVVRQTFTKFEYLIIDGGSSDKSLDIIDQYKDRITYWVSEPDKGIYNAMNKGIKKSTSEYIMFLNSGDSLFDDAVLSDAVPLLTGEDIIYGDLIIEEPERSWVKIYPPELSFSYFFNDSLPHSGGIFINKKAFRNELSFYDETLQIISDWKWFMIGIFKYLYTYKHIDRTIGVFDYSGISSKIENRDLLINEMKQVLDKHFPIINKEINDLLKYREKYNILNSSRYIQLCLQIKKVIKFW